MTRAGHGAGVEHWAALTKNDDRRIDLSRLPDPFPAERPWIALAGGKQHPVLAMNQLGQPSVLGDPLKSSGSRIDARPRLAGRGAPASRFSSATGQTD
jgi:hypothetical protein